MKTLLLLIITVMLTAIFSCTKQTIEPPVSEPVSRSVIQPAAEQAKTYLISFGAQSNGCNLFALLTTHQISMGVMYWYDIQVYEVCPGGSTNYLHYEMGLAWNKVTEIMGRYGVEIKNEITI